MTLSLPLALALSPSLSPSLSLIQAVLLVGVSFLAGAVNSIAGGGSLLTFAALLLFGVSPLHANATSTLALVPGSLSSLWGFRRSLDRDHRYLVAIGLPSLVGGTVGAFWLLRVGEARFGRLAPWLVLAATFLFVGQEPLVSWLRRRRPASAAEDPGRATLPYPILLPIAGLQFCIAVYGGFFGSGMGMLMLAMFGLAGMASIHRMNALKHLAAVAINGLATLIFIRHRCIEWQPGLLMAGAASLGGYLGARTALGAGARRVRWAILVINLAIAAATFWRLWRSG